MNPSHEEIGTGHGPVAGCGGLGERGPRQESPRPTDGDRLQSFSITRAIKKVI
jgi:hypothetical protein